MTETKLITMCCVCHKVKNENNDWQEKIISDEKIVSHGYCPQHLEITKIEYELYTLNIKVDSIRNKYNNLPNGPERFELWAKDKELMLKIRILENSLDKLPR